DAAAAALAPGDSSTSDEGTTEKSCGIAGSEPALAPKVCTRSKFAAAATAASWETGADAASGTGGKNSTAVEPSWTPGEAGASSRVRRSGGFVGVSSSANM